MSQTSTQKRGQDGEEAAARFLQHSGYTLLERNWRAGNSLRGEIDCIARHGKTLCFVEVKTRASNEHGAPQEAVTRGKQRQLSRLANAYVSMHRLADVPCRFDVVEVWLPHDGTAPRLALHQNAFDYVESGPAAARGARIF
jgi:putative endonuclease